MFRLRLKNHKVGSHKVGIAGMPFRKVERPYLNLALFLQFLPHLASPIPHAIIDLNEEFFMGKSQWRVGLVSSIQNCI